MHSPCRTVVVSCLAMLALAGCVIARNPSPPAEWAQPDARRVGTCPSLAGVYQCRGTLALESGVPCGSSKVPGEWQCSQDLLANLGLADSADAVELRQPDGETLEVLLRPGAGEPERRALKLGTDFSCDADSLYMSQTANLMPNTAFTAIGLMVLTGGVVNHTRSFARDGQGALVMTVRERRVFLLYGVPMVLSATSHVRWSPNADPQGDAR